MSDLLLPTTVVGSHAYPSWFLTALDEIKAGRYGITDQREALDKAVNAKIALHVWYGNLGSRPCGPRCYEPLFPDFHQARADQFVVEFANREMREIEQLKEFCGDREVGLGIVDIKSFYVEPVDEIAARIRQALGYIEPEEVFLNPDCGFFQLRRWLTVLKLQRILQAAKRVRHELTG